jgi:hypothetical protein
LPTGGPVLEFREAGALLVEVFEHRGHFSTPIGEQAREPIAHALGCGVSFRHVFRTAWGSGRKLPLLPADYGELRHT